MLQNVKKIYFIGIGGIGMSAAAGIARAKGYQVLGSDDSDVYEPSKGILDWQKIPYTIGYSEENLTEADLVISTAAVGDDNPEVIKAKSLGIPITSYPQLLGELLQDKFRIVVSGTHGKGSTSGLIAAALKELEDASFFIGGVLNELNTNFYYGKGKKFILEGDEYKSSHTDLTPKFNYYKPDLLLINNLEFDHPDVYPTFESLKDAFRKLIREMPSTGTIVYNADDSNVKDVISTFEGKKVGYSFNGNAEIQAQNPILLDGNFTVKGKANGEGFELATPLPGMPYAYNILAAASVLFTLGYKSDQFSQIVRKYTGVKRRFEIIYDGSITIIDDYAHHPTAVKQTLEATKLKYPDRRIICFFEPHTYSRTKETLDDLALAFAAADLSYIAEVYPAREQKLPSNITGEEVVARIKENQPNVELVKNKVEALEKFNTIVKAGDVVIVMAVGSFNTLVYDFKKYAEQR